MGLYSAIIIQPPVEMKRHVAQRSKKPAPVFFSRFDSVQAENDTKQLVFFSFENCFEATQNHIQRQRKRENERDWNRGKKHGTLL